MTELLAAQFRADQHTSVVFTHIENLVVLNAALSAVFDDYTLLHITVESLQELSYARALAAIKHEETTINTVPQWYQLYGNNIRSQFMSYYPNGAENASFLFPFSAIRNKDIDSIFVIIGAIANHCGIPITQHQTEIIRQFCTLYFSKQPAIPI